MCTSLPAVHLEIDVDSRVLRAIHSCQKVVDQGGSGSVVRDCEFQTRHLQSRPALVEIAQGHLLQECTGRCVLEVLTVDFPTLHVEASCSDGTAGWS